MEFARDENIKGFLWKCDEDHKNIYEYIYWPYSVNSVHNSKHMFDIYSLTHLFWPMLLAMLINKVYGNGMYNLMVVVGVFTIMFEIYENLPNQIKKYRRIEIDSSGKTSYRGDSGMNILGDIIFNVLGIYMGYKLDVHMVVGTLLVTFLVITKTIGISYWDDFIRFLFNV